MNKSWFVTWGVLIGISVNANAQTPVLYYNFDQMTGTAITNLGSTAAAGVLQGTGGDERWVTDTPPNSFSPSGALQFDGDGSTASGDYIDTQLSTTLLGMNSQNYTAAFWVKFDAVGGDKFILGQFGGTWVHLGTRGNASHYGHFGADSSGTTVIVPNQWYHMIFMFQGGQQVMFLDGDTEIAPIARAALGSTANLLVGRSQRDNSALPGVVDDLVIYDQSLTPSQIAHLAGGGDPMNLPEGSDIAGPFYTAQLGAGGTWNLYAPVADAATNWWAAHRRAISAVDPLSGSGRFGHLAFPDTGVENAVVSSIGGGANLWIGITDSEFFGGAESGGDPGLGWVYATNGVDSASPVSFFSWFGGEPSDSAPGGEDGVHIRANSLTWNDHKSDIPGGTDTNGPNYAYVVEWDIQSPTPVTNAIVVQAILPDVLPGPEGEAMFWGGLEVRDNGTIRSIQDAVSSLIGGNGTIVTGETEVINFSDASNQGDGGFIQGNQDMLSNRNGDDNDISGLYKALVRIPTNGTYTFGTRFDDGFALRIRSQAWTRVVGNATIDPFASDTIYHTSGGGNARGVIDLAAGDYAFEYVAFEATGNAFWELFAAEGAFDNEGDTTDWRLVGYKTADTNGVPAVAGPWTVIMDDPGGTQIDNLGIATNELRFAVTSTSQWDELNFRDPDGGGFGSIPGDSAFPNDVAGTGDDDFALGATNTLVIPVDGTYQFGFQGDDGGAIQIVGQPWDRVVHSATANTVIDGDVVFTDALTGNSRTVAEITLAQGSYPITVVFFERGGGAYFEMWHQQSTGVPVLLNDDTPFVITNDFAGLQLVSDEPPALVISSVQYTDADQLEIIWASEPSATYTVQISFDGTSWNDLTTGVASQGDSTTQVYPGNFGMPFVMFRVALEP